MKRRTLVKLLSASAALTLGGVGYAATARNRNPYYRGLPSDHFDGVRFFSPGQAQDRGLVELARWQLGHREPWPDSFPSPFADKPPERVEGLRVALIEILVGNAFAPNRENAFALRRILGQSFGNGRGAIRKFQ